MRKTKPDLSVVVLCYKSGEFAKVFSEKVIKVLNGKKIDYEIVLVANYWPKSDDITPAVVKEISAKNKRIVAIAKPKKNKNHNMGWDMRQGFSQAKGNVIAVIDGDGQIDTKDILRIYKHLREKDLDLCKIRRVSRKDGLYRQTISGIYNILMQMFFPGVSTDINGKPKIFKANVYKKMKLSSNDWFIDAEMMIKARRLKLKVGEIKGSFKKNPERKSFITFRENFEFLKNIIRWRLDEFKI